MSTNPQEITPELLLHAYTQGVFPMAETATDPEIFWVDPKVRGVMPLDGFHVSRSLRRRINKGNYETRINTMFKTVVEQCADRDETWINQEIFSLYLSLHEAGFAHSFEIHRDNQLTGGVYGVALGGAFFGESMFSKETDASKLALKHLVDHLNTRGFMLFDTQFITPHLASLGAKEMSRETYHLLLQEALSKNASFV